MSNIRNRLKLEGEVPERCNKCLPWGDEMRIAHRHEDGPMSEPIGPPERCESCGYEPLHIIVRLHARSGEDVEIRQGERSQASRSLPLLRRLKK